MASSRKPKRDRLARGKARERHFKEGGDSATWRGRAVTFTDRKRDKDKKAARGRTWKGATLLVAFWLLVSCTPAQEAGWQRIHDTRVEHGQPLALPHLGLMEEAQRRAEALAAGGELHHTEDPWQGVHDDARWVYENVGVGPDAEALHEAFVASPSHLRNLLRDIDWIGYGEATGPDGRLWVVHLMTST